MIGATDLKNGKTFVMEGKPFSVIKYEHQKIGRGGANVKLNLRNLTNGQVEQKTFNSNSRVEEINTSKRPLQFLFRDAEVATFMDPKTFEQIEILTDVVKDQLVYIKEGETVDILFWDDRALSVDIAPKTTLQVTETDPGVKGDTTSSVYKAAKLENGLNIRVPLFINKGDKVRIDTRTGEYVERAK